MNQVFILGAGTSVEAGIPDFRSKGGLFEDLKKKYPALASGKDMFNISVYQNMTSKAAFYLLMGQMHKLAMHAEPTPFHQLLYALDCRQSLRRVYSQNIDSLERKAGIPSGVPDVDRGKQPDIRCVQLHGELETLRCAAKAHTARMSDFVDDILAGAIPECAECAETRDKRREAGQRSHGRSSELRPNVRLYGEEHPDGECLATLIMNDVRSIIRRKSPTILLVVGTSLETPGAIQVIQKICEALRDKTSQFNLSSGRNIKTIYVNYQLPSPRKWHQAFDVWVCGDIQEFARHLLRRMNASPQPGSTRGEPKARKVRNI